MKKQTSDNRFHFFATVYYLCTGIFVMLSATRDITSYESLIEVVLFMFLVGGLYVSTILRVYWISFYFFILMLFYNPIFLVIHDVENFPIADIGVGISFFVLGLHWRHFIEERS